MMALIRSSLLLTLFVSGLSEAAWDFRGEPNNWGSTRLTYVGENRHFIRQTFLSNQDEFKIAHDSGWQESYPNQNFFVSSGKTYDITFFDNSKRIQVDEVSTSENWVFRGSSNGWGKTAMTRVGNDFVICQNFGSDDPRFKISNGNKIDWSENYPEQDFRVAANKSVDIRFTPSTRAITTTERSAPCAQVAIDNERSLLIRDEATLNATAISLRQVFDQLTNQMNLTNLSAPTTSSELFARFWDTQNTAPGTVLGGPKCGATLNGFPNACRDLQEGQQALEPDRFIADYRLVALVNRFDLRNKINFNDCGEYRMVFALQNGPGRNFIIFEARLPNPQPGNVAGCASIASFWGDLSGVDSSTVRANSLRNFYFNGIAGKNVRAVIDWRNYSSGLGQVRTNQFMNFGPWVLKEFNTAMVNGVSVFNPVSVKATPFGALFRSTRSDPLALEFRDQFVANSTSLLGTDLTQISLTVPNNAHNNGHSHASGDALFDNDYVVNSNGNTALLAALQNKLSQLGSSLSSEQLLRRATAMSCAGCHQPTAFALFQNNALGDGKSWPDSLGFTHIGDSPSAGKFPISPALQNVFLPARKTDLINYLNSL